MKSLLGIALLGLIPTCTAFSQSLERFVFNSFGSSVQTGSLQLTNNAGEPLTQYYYNGLQSRILTEGFIQPYEKDLDHTSITENAGADFGISVWPNPATEAIHIGFAETNAQTWTAALYDLNGKCLLLENICTGCTSHYLPLPVMADGTYVLRVTGESAQKEFKFLKVSTH